MATPRAKSAALRAPVAEAPELRAPEPAREAIRQAIPTIPGRVVGVSRSGNPVQRAAAESGVDTFFIPPHLPPQDWSWEWKRETNRGETDPMYMSQLHQVGWEPVMYESYPGVFAPEYDDQGKPTKGPVRRGGLMLMERDMRLTLEAMADETRKANERVGNAKRQYNHIDTSGSQTATFDSTAQRASYIRTGTPEPLNRGNGGPSRQPID